MEVENNKNRLPSSRPLGSLLVLNSIFAKSWCYRLCCIENRFYIITALVGSHPEFHRILVCIHRAREWGATMKQISPPMIYIDFDKALCAQNVFRTIFVYQIFVCKFISTVRPWKLWNPTISTVCRSPKKKKKNKAKQSRGIVILINWIRIRKRHQWNSNEINELQISLNSSSSFILEFLSHLINKTIPRSASVHIECPFVDL